MTTAKEFIEQYQLQPHPEGGWYKETYRSKETIAASSLPERFTGEKNFSAFHKIKSDECWHFYAGDALHVYLMYDDDKMEIIKLGSNIANGELFQYVVPANCWFASLPAAESKFCFVGCTVAPGFDFADFQ